MMKYLRLDDIKGTNIGSKNKINKFNSNNYELTTQDIKGCNVGSLKKGIVTQRCTNPLMPEYQYLGEKELQGFKFGEYSKKQRAKSVITNSKNNKNINKNINKEEAKNEKNNINEPKMVRINDIEQESNNNNIKYEEQKNENDITSEMEGGYSNDTINFDFSVKSLIQILDFHMIHMFNRVKILKN